MEVDNKEKRVKVKEVTLVGVWKWKAGDQETCAICKNLLIQSCEECATKESLNNKEIVCEIVWGQCNHAFHDHCISKWVKTKNTCPLDHKTWERQQAQQ